jgi:CBS domain-containing protein
VDLHASLNGESVEAAYPTEPLTVEPDASVSDVFALLKAHNSGKVLICRQGVLIGIFTERDALKLMAKRADLNVPVERVMVHNPVTIRSGDSVSTAIRKMSDGGYRRLPIVDASGRPLGIAGVTGIVHFLVEHFPSTVYNLPPDPQPMMQQREGA